MLPQVLSTEPLDTKEGVGMQDMTRLLKAKNLDERAVMRINLITARQSMIPYRVAEGFKSRAVDLLTHPNENIKLAHSRSDRVAAYGLSLAPAGESGYQVCRWRTKGCESACQGTSGNGRYDKVRAGRIWKTKWLANEPENFLRVLVDEIDTLKVSRWRAAGWKVSLRLNVFSDLNWAEITPWLIRRTVARDIFVYDYTKEPGRGWKVESSGYDVSYSVSEKTTQRQLATERRPVVVVDVRRGHKLPAIYAGRSVIDGDVSDARFLEHRRSVVLLRFKRNTGATRVEAIASGFVRTLGHSERG